MDNAKQYYLEEFACYRKQMIDAADWLNHQDAHYKIYLSYTKHTAVLCAAFIKTLVPRVDYTPPEVLAPLYELVAGLYALALREGMRHTNGKK